MGEKGKQTRELIKKEAYRLFADKGFKEVTMKDICQQTGLSRGGLYRHYGSTAVIFEELFRKMSENSIDEFERQMKSEIPAPVILKEILSILREDIQDANNSMSLAIYEYSNAVSSSLFTELNEAGTEKWRRFLAYGIKRGEFREIDIAQAVDMILYSYQGARMWSRVIPLKEETADHVINAITEMLIGGSL